ncbi:CHAT domain-containing protein [Streptomyces sp. NPDC127091]|uniref:CHAT domain-containing protein n=1 Tax=Streptomyces sp. NPDC127091 TaxID=3347134 RepID=UPI00364941F2
MRDHLLRVRNTWIDLLAAQVCHKLVPRRCSVDMFPAWVRDDQLALAAVVSRIAVEDAWGSSSETISDGLLSTGVVVSRVPAVVVARDLVTPVLRTVRNDGVPWRQWWDVGGLSMLLVELWTGRRLLTRPQETVRRELAMLWGGRGQNFDTLLKNAADPFACLPSDLLLESATGAAVKIMRILVAAGKMKNESEDEFLRIRPGLVDRPDLAEVARRWNRRNQLELALPGNIHGISTEVGADFLHDIEVWDAQMLQVVSSLSMYELELMEPVTDDKRYRDKCLSDGRGIHHARFGPDDSLLWTSDPGMSEDGIPDWIHEEIVSRGMRCYHEQVGPHPVWLVTAETQSQLASLALLMESGARYGIGVVNTDDGVRVRLVLPAVPGDFGGDFEVPYSYNLSWVEPAWELLVLSAVGYARLVVVRLVDDGELRAVGSIRIKLPEEVRSQLEKAAVPALRRLVGDETKTIMWRRATEGIGHAAEAAFQSCETAKAEDLDDEIALASDSVAAENFALAVRRLALVRARQAACLLDGKNFLDTATEIKSAVEERQQALGALHEQLKREGRYSRSRGSEGLLTLDGQTLFVHLVNWSGTLQLVAASKQGDRWNFEILPYRGLGLANLTEAVREWARDSPGYSERTRYEYLRQLLGTCTELAQSIYEATAQQRFRRLVLSPTPPVELLPLHAAPLGKAHTLTLSDTFDHVVYNPTARLLSAIERSPRRAAAVDVLIVAHSGEGIPHLHPIAGPLAEADLIATLHSGAEILKEGTATPDQALLSMSRARIVHVACHGLTHSNRWAAGLALHGSSLGQATLTAGRIAADGVFSSVDLVVLNACRTGAHESAVLSIQTLRSIESAFLARGAKAVISTLWEISDLQGLIFSTLLHTHLSVGAGPGSAYRETIRYLRTHQWRMDSRYEPVAAAEALISSVLPDWQSHLEEQAAANPLFWAAFKITGSV